jgi:hypothetical protein
MDYLDQFMKHELLIQVTGADIDALNTLDNIIGIRVADGSFLSNHLGKEGYLHCRQRTDGSYKITYSITHSDVHNNGRNMDYINYTELIEHYSGVQIDILPEELTEIISAGK